MARCGRSSASMIASSTCRGARIGRIRRPAGASASQRSMPGSAAASRLARCTSSSPIQNPWRVPAVASGRCRLPPPPGLRRRCSLWRSASAGSPHWPRRAGCAPLRSCGWRRRCLAVSTAHPTAPASPRSGSIPRALSSSPRSGRPRCSGRWRRGSSRRASRSSSASWRKGLHWPRRAGWRSPPRAPIRPASC